MKKARVMIVSLAAMVAVSGVFAFKAKNFTNPTLWFATTTGVKGTAITIYTTVPTVAPTTTGYTTLTSTATVNPALTTLYDNAQ